MDFEIKFVPKLEIPFVEVISQFVFEYVASANVAVVDMLQCLFVLKGTNPAEWEEVKKASKNLDDMKVTDVIDLIKDLGNKVPMIRIDGKSGLVTINYRQQQVLDFRHPHFFDHLELILDHMLNYDDLSQFSLSIENASCSIRDSQDCEPDLH